MTNWKQNLALLALTFVFAAMVWGQGANGTITGTVTDPSGAAIVVATVTATNTGTGATFTAITNELGLYRFVDLQVGMYTVKVEAKGFRTVTLSAQRLVVASTLRLDVALEVGEVNTSITVESVAQQVTTDDAQLGQTMTQIDNLPILSGNGGRNALNLVALQPGVTLTPAGAAPGTSVGPFSVNGQRTQANNFMLDGADSNDLAINTPDSVDVISPNALGEFRVVTGAMKAEYGRNSGAVIESTIKSGTNAFHGQATEVFRNRDLNANNFFLNQSGSARPQFNLNDFDANLGGPIIRNKTFFFASYLGFRRALGVFESGTVFTDAERAAILAHGVPAAQNIVNITPAANSAGNQYASAPVDRLTRDQGVLKIDHQITDSNRLSVSYFTERSTDINPFAQYGVTIPGFGETDLRTNHNVALHDTHVFSPNLINEALASYHRLDSPAGIPQNHQTPADLGFTGIIPDDPAGAGPPFMIIGGTNVGNTYEGPQGRADNTWQYRDTVSWIKGRHSFKFGAEYRAYEQNQTFDFINSGYMLFTGDGTLGTYGISVPQIPGISDPAVNDFANGFLLFFDQSNATKQGTRDKFFSAFAQDDIKVTRNLTVNLGLRYDYGNPISEIHNRLNTFRPGQQSTVFPTAPVGLVFPGDAGISNSTYSPDRLNFGPRFGIAWDPTGKGKLSIRTGFGLFYNVPETELTLQFLAAPPFGAQVISELVTDMTQPYATSNVPAPRPNPFPYPPVKPGDKFDFTSVAPVLLTGVMDPHFQTPSAMQYNLQVQYEIGKNWLAEAGYVGTQGRHLENRRNINPALVTPTATNGDDDARRIYNLGNPQNDQYGGAVFSGITDQLSDGNSSYNSLQLSLTKRASHGLTLTNAYTYAHCIDNVSGLRGGSNPFSSSYDRGNCDQDVRHSYVGSVIYELPWFHDQRGFIGHVLGGFSISSLVTLQSGIPFDITDGSGDRSLTGAGDDRPDYVGGAVQFADPRANAFGLSNSWFNGAGGGTGSADTNPNFHRVGSSGSVAQGAGRYGNFGRNVFHGPGTLNTDLRIAKQIHLTERQSLLIRGEAFNFFNHTQFFNPNGAIDQSTFGQVTLAHDPRLIQFTMQYRF